MSAPTSHSWVGVGIGENMADAFMLIAYASANGTGVTTSPRVAVHGNSEPTWAEDKTFEKIFSDAYAPSMCVRIPCMRGGGWYVEILIGVRV